MSFLQALNYLKGTLARSVDGACAVPAVFIQYHPGTLLGQGATSQPARGLSGRTDFPRFSLCIHLIVENLREP